MTLCIGCDADITPLYLQYSERLSSEEVFCVHCWQVKQQNAQSTTLEADIEKLEAEARELHDQITEWEGILYTVERQLHNKRAEHREISQRMSTLGRQLELIAV